MYMTIHSPGFDFDLLIIGLMSIVCFSLFAYDKFCAVSGKKRVPKWLLIATTILGGGFGALCAMILCRHEVKNGLYLALVPAMAVIIVAIDACLRMQVFN